MTANPDLRQVTQPEPGRWLVPTQCHICFIDVEASDKSPNWRWVNVSLLSTHAGAWEGRWRTRIRNAWDVLRGQGHTFLELLDDEELGMFIDTLIAARQHAFGQSHIQESTASGEGQSG